MQLRKLVVTNNRGATLELPLEDASGGTFVKGIDGLGPVKATLVSSSFANQDGGQYHSSRRESRNLVLKLGLEPSWGVESVAQIRSQLYSYFMPKTRCLLAFNVFNEYVASVSDQNLDVQIVGHIESCEPDIFAKDPSLDVSIMCFDPDFVDIEPVIHEGLTTGSLISESVLYEGTVETGVIFRLLVDRDIDGFSMYWTPPDENLHSLDYESPLLDGDVLEISSVFGDKYAKLIRAGVETSVLWGLSPQSGWFELYPGWNEVRVYTPGDAIPYELEYTTKYGGL